MRCSGMCALHSSAAAAVELAVGHRTTGVLVPDDPRGSVWGLGLLGQAEGEFQVTLNTG